MSAERRLIDIFARPGPPPKRIAPKRRDVGLDARHPSRNDRNPPMPKYIAALDAAPQDGRWLDDPTAVTTVLQFLLSKLPPDQLAELDDHLTKGTTPQAMDRRLPEGNLKRDLLKYTPKNRRAMLDALSGAPGMPMTMDEITRRDPDYGKSFEERFPNANRLKKGIY